jgi:hypothetical protein
VLEVVEADRLHAVRRREGPDFVGFRKDPRKAPAGARGASGLAQDARARMGHAELGDGAGETALVDQALEDLGRGDGARKSHGQLGRRRLTTVTHRSEVGNRTMRRRSRADSRASRSPSGISAPRGGRQRPVPAGAREQRVRCSGHVQGMPRRPNRIAARAVMPFRGSELEPADAALPMRSGDLSFVCRSSTSGDGNVTGSAQRAGRSV